MILVAVGTQKYPFDRLLKKIETIDEDFVIQKGYSKISLKNKSFKFSDKLENYLDSAQLVIAHAGVGITMQAFELKKPLIVVPRLKKYNEHIDDHQLELCHFLEENNYALVCYDINTLETLIKKVEKHKFNKYRSNTENFNKNLMKLIEEL